MGKGGMRGVAGDYTSGGRWYCCEGEQQTAQRTHLYVFVLVPEVLRYELHSLSGPVGLRRQEGVGQVRVSPAQVSAAAAASPAAGSRPGPAVGVVRVVGGVRHVVERRAHVVVVVLVLLLEAALAALVQLAGRVVQVGQLHHLDLVLVVQVGRRARRRRAVGRVRVDAGRRRAAGHARRWWR